MTGYHCGAVAVSLLALAVHSNWQVLFYVNGVAGFLLAGIMVFKLAETVPARAQSSREEKVTVVDLLRPRYLRATLPVWVATFMGLLLVYGLNTWLPSLMKTAGYSVSTSITLLFVLNAGGVLGMLVAGRIGDTRGISRTALIWFGLGAVLLAALSVRIHATVALDVIIFLTGVFVFSAQVLVYAYITRFYPARIRGSALGIDSGIGRIGGILGPTIAGVLVSAGAAYPWGFYFFAGAAVLGMLAIAAAPQVKSVPAADSAPVSAPPAPATATAHGR